MSGGFPFLWIKSGAVFCLFVIHIMKGGYASIWFTSRTRDLHPSACICVFVCECVCVCVCVCVYVYVYVYVFVYVYRYVYVYLFVYVYVYVYACLTVYACVCICVYVTVSVHVYPLSADLHQKAMISLPLIQKINRGPFCGTHPEH